MVDTKKKIISKEKKQSDRAARLEAALRANLQRRKKQTKLRLNNSKPFVGKE
jgi:hypothetical protein